MNYNVTILAGHVVQTPELKKLPSGQSVVNFALAINKVWTDPNTKEKREDVTFIDVIFFGKQADTIAQYVVKGKVLLVQGHLKKRSWDDKDGKKQYRTEVIGDTFQFGADPSDASTKRTGYQKSQGIPANKANVDTDGIPEYQGEEIISNEDVPF